MQSRDEPWSSSTECQWENLPAKDPGWSLSDRELLSAQDNLSISIKINIKFTLHRHSPPSTPLSRSHTHRRHEFADTAPGANHKYFKFHHSYLYSQQKGENKVPTYVQHVTSPASLAIISWTLNNKHQILDSVCYFSPAKLNISMYLQ